VNAVLLAGLGLCALLADGRLRSIRPRPPGGAGRAPAGGAGHRRPGGREAWAPTGAALARLQAKTTTDTNRIPLGHTSSRRPLARRRLACEPFHSLAVIGPSQSGKTVSTVIPAILSWPGALIASSVKSDLLDATIAWRRQCGQVRCYDPAGALGQASATWSLVDGCREWRVARQVAERATRCALALPGGGDGEFWRATAAKLLAPLLLAAAWLDADMAEVIRWVNLQEVHEVMAGLELAACPEAVDSMVAACQRDERQRSSVYTTLETVLEPFADALLAHRPGAARHRVDVDGLLGGANTLYLCGPTHDQRRYKSILSLLLQQVLDTAMTSANANGGRLAVPLLVVLDEAAHVAAPEDLDALLATASSHGIQLVTVCQDLSQIDARYGSRAGTILNNHRAKLLLSGIGDYRTLEWASQVAGTREVEVLSRTVDPAGAVSTSSTSQPRNVVDPHALRTMGRRHALLVYGALAPVRLTIEPWWKDADLRRRGSGGSG